MADSNIINRVQGLITSFVDDESGATFIEYTLIVAVVSLALLTFFGNTATSMGDNYTNVADRIANP